MGCLGKESVERGEGLLPWLDLNTWNVAFDWVGNLGRGL